MVEIKITKGLDIPLAGQPTGTPIDLARPTRVSLNLKPFEDVKFRLLVKPGDLVKIGQPLALDKDCPDRVFVAPGAGLVKEILRGHKRHPTDIVIELSDHEEAVEGLSINPASSTREQILKALLAGGLFCQIRQRPFNQLADPTKTPRSIFVKALESAPLTPSAELQVQGLEEEFAIGLQALSKLTPGNVHLVYRKGSSCRAFTEAQHVQSHTAEGPHPIANHSVHIHAIDPITTTDAVIWTVTALDVVAIGYYLRHGKPYLHRIISIAGPGVLENRAGYARVRAGHPISAIMAGHIPKAFLRYISGDPLMGDRVEADDYLGFSHTVFTVIPEGTNREFLHFLRLGVNKFTASGCYLSGHLKGSERLYDFTTSQHGEPRAFVSNIPYNKVMPLPISPMLLCKALMAEDYELADELGLLEVDSEDFALPTFVCPSKIEQTEIVKQGLRTYAREVLQ